MKRLKPVLVVLAITLFSLMTGCYPDKIDTVEEYDVAATYYDEEADFSRYTTFSLIDTVLHLTEDGKDDPNLSRDYDELILDNVRQHMFNLGYAELENPDSLKMPDLEVMVEALSMDFYTYIYYWYDYWYWYPGWDWCYPGGGWWYPGYPWYPGGGYVSSYSTGTLMIEIMDTKAGMAETERPGMVWMGVANGLLSGSNASTALRIDKQINQLFEQSPYLQP